MELAVRLGGEIVNADAFQLYRGLDICTAKPSAPDSSPVKLDRIYDAASRLIEEWSPAVHTASGDVRAVTAFTYDSAGNMTSKALNYATIASDGTRTNTLAANQRVKYDYYDAANRRAEPCFSRPGSRVSAWVIPTNEELMTARHTGTLLGLVEAGV